METATINGLKYFFRLMTIGEKNLFLESFSKLSMTSKYFRFHYPIKKLTKKDINYLLKIDNYHHLAIGVAIKIKNNEYGAGLIR